MTSCNKLVLFPFPGDNDSILLMLLIPRLIFKIELLQNQLKQKVMKLYLYGIREIAFLACWVSSYVAFEKKINQPTNYFLCCSCGCDLK